MRVVRVFLAASRRGRCLRRGRPRASGDEGDLAAARERANAAAAERSPTPRPRSASSSPRSPSSRPARRGRGGAGRAAGHAAGDGRRRLHRRAARAAAQFITGEDINASVQAPALACLVTQGNADAVDEYRVVRRGRRGGPGRPRRHARPSSATSSRTCASGGAELDAELARLEASRGRPPRRRGGRRPRRRGRRQPPVRWQRRQQRRRRRRVPVGADGADRHRRLGLPGAGRRRLRRLLGRAPLRRPPPPGRRHDGAAGHAGRRPGVAAACRTGATRSAACRST